MYAASGDERYKERVDYIIKELAECQDARKTGYVGGIPNEDKIWAEVSSGDIRSQGFDLNGGWDALGTRCTNYGQGSSMPTVTATITRPKK